MEQSYVCKEGERDTTLCRIYSGTALVRNAHSSGRTFIFAKDHTLDVPVSQVWVNGDPVNVEEVDDTIRFSASIPPHGIARVTVVYKNLLPVARAPSLLAAGRVLARRMLSEFRDDVISRNDFLWAGYSAAKANLSRPNRQSLEQTQHSHHKLAA
jgi:hypothetical protein